jgi:hypothetical protein
LDGKKYELYAVAVLNDHVHMIINPIVTLSEIMHSIKSFTAHEINKISNRNGKVWQDESHDRVIRSEEEFLEKLGYIINNPIKANSASKYEEYKWLYIKRCKSCDSDRRDACPTGRGDVPKETNKVLSRKIDNPLI